MAESTQLEGYACIKCKWSDVFPVQICPRCHSPTSHTVFQNVGQIASFTVVRYPPQGFEKESPYVVALIDLQNGPRVMARVSALPENLQMGERVRFTGSNNGVLQFKPDN